MSVLCGASVCSKRAQFKCAKCENQFYCGTRCQAKHWSEHSIVCGDPVAPPPAATAESVDGFASKVDTALYRNFLIVFNSGMKIPKIQRILSRYVTFRNKIDLEKFERINFISDRFKRVLKKASFLGRDFGTLPPEEELAQEKNRGKSLLQISLEKDRAEYDTLSPLKKSQVFYDVLVSLIDVYKPKLPLTLKEKLGQGTYGTVYRADAKGYGTFAAKVFFDEEDDDEDSDLRRESAEDERTLLTFVNRLDLNTGKKENDHVLAFVGYYPDFELDQWSNDPKTAPMLLSEYISGATLEEFEFSPVLDKNKERPKKNVTPWMGKDKSRAQRAQEASSLEEESVRLETPGLDLKVQFPKMVEEMFEGLRFLHSKGIAHRDIKPDNVMLDDSLRLVLIDLGLSCQVNDEHLAKRILSKFQCDADDYSTQGGSWQYNSPEVSQIYLYNYRVQSGEFDDANGGERPVLQKNPIQVQLQNDLWAAALTLFDVLFLSDPESIERAPYAMEIEGFTEVYEGYPNFIAPLSALSRLRNSAREQAIKRMSDRFVKIFEKETRVLQRVLMGELKTAEDVLAAL